MGIIKKTYNRIYNSYLRIENFILPPSKDGHHQGGWETIGYLVVSLIVSWIFTNIFAEDIDTQSTSTTEEATGQEEKGVKINTRSTQVKIPIVYGLRRVGGNDIYGFTSGNENRDLYLVQTISEGECEGIYQEATVSGSVDQIWFGDQLWNEFGENLGDNVDYWFHNGASNQTVDIDLNGVDSNWTCALENTCYILFKLHYDRDYFRGLPTRQIELKGKKLYDFRDETTSWSDNPVICLYDFMINTRYGVGLSTSQIDETSWTTVANYCDDKEFTLNMVIKRDKSAWDVVQSILSHFRGTIGWWDGKFYLKYADLNYESSVMTIEDKHIFQGEDGKSAISISQPGRFSKPDGLKVKFVDKDKQYAIDDTPIGEQAGVINTFELLGCTDREMACKLAVSQLEKLQLDRSISGIFRDDCIMLEPHDIITFNSDDLGISDQLMRVTSATIVSEHLINLGLRYETYDLYNDVYDINVEGTYTCNLPNPNDKPPEVTNASIEEEAYWYRLISYIRLKIDFDEPTNYAWFDHVEVWLALEENPTTVDYKHQFDTTNNFEIDPVEEGQDYWIKLVTVNIWGVKHDFSTATTLHKNTVGKSSTIPTSLSYLSVIVDDNTLNFYSDKLTDPDIEIYEFRVGGSWTGGVFLAAIRSPNYCITGVKPGLFTFSANTKGTNNLYGATPRTASVEVYAPKGWTLYDITTYTDDYTTDPGTFDNTEHTSYSGDDYLKCSHTADVLTGTYISEIFDLGVGNTDIYYAYVDADIITTGAGTTWNAVTASGTSTWNNISADSKTWNELFEMEEAAKVDIELYYRKLDTDDWSIAKKMEICSTVVEARYFKVKITITDPSIAVNALVEKLTLCLYN